MIDKMALVNGYILVRQDEDAERTPSGLAIGDSMRPWMVYGTVVNAAATFIDHGNVLSTQIKVGYRVCYARIYGNDLIENGEKFHLLTFDQIIGVDTTPE